jgi:hypothetical protein
MQKPFEAGQVWRYATRPQEGESLVTICKVEPYGDTKVVHVSLSNLNLKNPHTPSGVQDTLPHLPLDEETLRACVTELAQENAPLTDYEEGYASWKEAQGGVWTVPLAEIVDLMEQTIQPKQKWWQRFKRS